jgi:hypothetical protein
VLSAAKPIVGRTGSFPEDLQAGRAIRIKRDWSRVGTDITGQGPFDGSLALVVRLFQRRPHGLYWRWKGWQIPTLSGSLRPATLLAGFRAAAHQIKAAVAPVKLSRRSNRLRLGMAREKSPVMGSVNALSPMIALWRAPGDIESEIIVRLCVYVVRSPVPPFELRDAFFEIPDSIYQRPMLRDGS